MKSISFKGKDIEYNEKALRSWKLQRQLAGLDERSGLFVAADALFNGKADEVAEMFDDDIDDMGELLETIIEVEGGEVKN